MAVISIRLNTEEELMVNFLSDYFEEERSSLFKRSLKEMYEDLVDKKYIEEFEKNERTGNTNFLSAEDILKSIEA